MATLINIFVPGLGQIVQGRFIIGCGLLLMTLVGYFLFIVPGIIMHIITIVDSAQYETQQRNKAHKELLNALKRNH